MVPTKLANALGQSVSYWSDVLRYKKASFAAAKAREVEALLTMRPFFLDGAGWPFESVDEAAFDRLTERQKGRVEQALIAAMREIEASTDSGAMPTVFSRKRSAAQ